jgi:hypothetical protein
VLNATMFFDSFCRRLHHMEPTWRRTTLQAVLLCDRGMGIARDLPGEHWTMT